jgi:hypothetical protein
MAAIDGNLAMTVLLAALAGGLDKPQSNWREIDVRLPAPHASQVLDPEGNFGSAESASRKITPADYFRIVELAPKAILAPEALKEAPTEAETLLRIRTGDGQDYFFVAEQERFKDRSTQEIWNILRHYRN